MNNPTDMTDEVYKRLKLPELAGWVVVYFDKERGKAVAQNFGTSEESYQLQVDHPESSLYRGQVRDEPLGYGHDDDSKSEPI